MSELVRFIIGLIIIVAGIGLGLWLGLWVMFIGGIIQVVQSIHPVVQAGGIAIGIAKVIFAQLVGWLCFYVLAGIGVGIMK